jgi:glycosyltransferase involved in cell wall biosynthesis
MKDKINMSFITVVPSPYQRDLFGALAARDDIELSVYYMEASAPDSPWPEAPLRPFERIMGGGRASFGGARAHANWPLPDLSQADMVVVSTYSSLTGQWLMRRSLRGKRWLFWGERMRSQPTRWRDMGQRQLAAPVARASGIVGIGREAERDYSRRFPELPHFCIPYYCDIKGFLRSTKQKSINKPMIFFFCGQMILRKGIDVLLYAFDRLIKKGFDIELLLVGRKANLDKHLGDICAEARKRVRYEGFQPPENLPEFFFQSDVFVLPSRHDGWGVVINQALAAGLPVIASDAVGAAMDLVEQNVNGLYCVAGEIDSLANAMEQLIIQPERARQFGEKSRKKSLDIEPEVGAEEWVKVYKKLISETSANADCLIH